MSLEQQQIDTKLAETEIEKAKQIANGIDVSNSQSIAVFGAEAQKDITDFSDKILEHVAAKDAGEAGNILSELTLKVKEINVDGMSEGSFLSKIPLFGSIFNKVQKILVQYQKISVQIEQLEQKLDKSKMDLLKGVATLDQLYDKNLKYFSDLSVYIAAGNLKLAELRETIIPEMEKQAKETNDQQLLQKLNDTVQFANRLEKKVYDLKLSQTISLQTAPQIRLIQSNNNVLCDKIQSSLTQTIPLWKSQFIVAIELFKQKKVLKQQQEVTNTTNEMLKKNSEMLKTGSIEIAKENERGIVDIETLKQTQANLIATLEETMKIQVDGQAKRKSAEAELTKMKEELKTKLLEMSQKTR